MNGRLGGTGIGDGLVDRIEKPNSPINFLEQQDSSVAGESSTEKIRDHFSLFDT